MPVTKSVKFLILLTVFLAPAIVLLLSRASFPLLIRFLPILELAALPANPAIPGALAAFFSVLSTSELSVKLFFSLLREEE